MDDRAFEQLREFDSQFILFPPFVAAKDRIEADLRLFRLTGIARHSMLLGEAGTGKSSLCRWFESLHPRQRLNTGDRIEVVVAVIPPVVTVGGIADVFLASLGAKLLNRTTIVERTEAIITLFRNCGVELLLIDEGQHLPDRGDVKSQYLVGDWFKNLIDRIGVPTVILGLPRLEEMLQTNEQLRRRFSSRIFLGMGQSETVSIETECLQLFNSLATLLHMPVSHSPFGPLEMGLRLYHASDGRVAYIKRLLFAALRTALEVGLDRIDAQLLEATFAREVWAGAVGPLNPFHETFVFRRLDRHGEPFQAPRRATRARRQ